MDVCAYGALGRQAAGLLVGAGQALLAQEVHGLVHIPTTLQQRLLCVHHACARLLPQLLDRLGINLHLRMFSPLLMHGWSGTSSGVSAFFVSITPTPNAC